MANGEHSGSTGTASSGSVWEVDQVVPYAVEELDVRGSVAYLGVSVDSILQRHNYPEPVCRLLGEAMVLTTLLGTSIKLKGRLILQTQSDGPVSLIVVDYRSPGTIRSYAKFEENLPEYGKSENGPGIQALLGKGHLAMTIDQGGSQHRYQGLVALEGSTFEDIAHRYFEQSEQIPTSVRLAVSEVYTRKNGGGSVRNWQAGGIITQFLPDNTERMRVGDLDPGDAPPGTKPHVLAEDDAWVEAKSLVQTVEDVELTAPDMSAEKLLYRLFHERGVRVFSPHVVGDKCDCTRENINAMLLGFKPEERREMIVDGQITVKCEFCNSVYNFKPAEFDE